MLIFKVIVVFAAQDFVLKIPQLYANLTVGIYRNTLVEGYFKINYIFIDNLLS